MTFRDDMEWTRQMRDRYLIKFYEQYSNGRYVFIDGNSTCTDVLQKKLAVDTIYQARDGQLHYVEEKIERWPGYERSNFALETESCTVQGREKDGWMRYAQSDLLLYGFALEDEEGIDLYTLRFQPLRRWFDGVNKRNYKQHTMDTLNRTRFWKVPITDVLRAPGVFPNRYIITKDGIDEMPLRATRIDLKQRREKLYREAIYASLDIIGDKRQAQYEEDPWLEEEDR